LSIHSIVTFPREAFYWLAVLVTFALGTATGDWTVELTGWGPGKSVLLPAGLIAAVLLAWKGGAGPVLSFWLAYILTRPLGANLGDWFASPRSEHGLGVGTAGTSYVFLGAIAITVAWLSFTRADVTENTGRAPGRLVSTPPTSLPRQRVALAGLALVAAGTTGLLVHTSQQPHAVISEEADAPDTPAAVVPIATQPAPTTDATGTARPAAPLLSAGDLAGFKQISQDTLDLLTAGKQAEATARITALETAWDDAQAKLQAKDPTGWKQIDSRIDVVLTQLRAKHPDPNSEHTALTNLLTVLG
jgi:hypothetical protein